MLKRKWRSEIALDRSIVSSKVVVELRGEMKAKLRVEIKEVKRQGKETERVIRLLHGLHSDMFARHTDI